MITRGKRMEDITEIMRNLRHDWNEVNDEFLSASEISSIHETMLDFLDNIHIIAEAYNNGVLIINRDAMDGRYERNHSDPKPPRSQYRKASANVNPSKQKRGKGQVVSRNPVRDAAVDSARLKMRNMFKRHGK